MDPFLIRLRRAAIPFRLAIGLAAGVATALAVILGLGTSFGIGGAAGLAALVIALYLLGLLIQASEHAGLRERAFLWQGSAAYANAVNHFTVRRSRDRTSGAELSPYVVRNVTSELEAGLTDERFVIIEGDRPSGKSRFIYEVLRGRPNVRVLVSRRAPRSAAEDPLIKLMNDRKGLKRSTKPTVLLLRDCVSRLISGDITADFITSWLDDNPQAAVIVTFNPSDIERIDQYGSALIQEFERLKRRGRLVSVSSRLTGQEMILARDKFSNLTDVDRECLPEYLCSAIPLREKFIHSLRGANAVGHAIVCAVADWRRAGMARPASIGYIRSVIGHYISHDTDSDFDANLVWACEPVDSVMSLIREHDGGYVPDPIVVDMLDKEHGRHLPDYVWNHVLREIDNEGGQQHIQLVVVDDLIALGIAALERENQAFAEQILANAHRKGDEAQRERVAQQLAPKATSGSPRALVITRAGDTIRQRVTETQRLVDTSESDGASPFSASKRLWRRFIAWVYTRRTARTFARLWTLIIIDAASVVLGVSAGLAVRAGLDGHRLSGVESSVVRFLPLWVTVAVLVFTRLGLYRQDAPRARLSPILLAATMLGGIGLIAAWVADPKVGAVPGAVLGCSLAVAVCYRLRVKYDQISRRWVWRHGLEARTLLIGSCDQASSAKKALTGISRPMMVVGYITPATDGPADEESLGTVEDLAAVAHEHSVGRVVIVDPDMPPAERQRLANTCHNYGLLVEAIPSLADIRAGSADFVAGQKIVLMRLDPLWPANLAFFAKRAFDLILAAPGIVVLAVIWIPVEISARLEGGPALVRSLRYGLGERPFGMYRFRTTLPGSPHDSNDGADPMVDLSWLGRFLRKRGLDELPQLLNVWAGDMSIVGPRPLHPSDHARLRPEQHLRYVVRPGITGPWLVCQSTRLSFAELTALDFAYLHRWTIITDLDILAKTLRLIVTGRSEFPAVTD
jgi:lipopolysaccharide/colanic/teichoic acid biosynthesis glycosyltransferase